MSSTSIAEINTLIHRRLRTEGLEEVTANEAAKWLDRAGLLADSSDRPGRNLRKLLRDGSIRGSIQRPSGKHGRWFITKV